MEHNSLISQIPGSIRQTGAIEILTVAFYAMACFAIAIFTPSKSFAKAEDTPTYQLSVSLFPEAHALQGRALIALPAGASATLTSSVISIEKLKINGEQQKLIPSRLTQTVNAGQKGMAIEVNYTAIFEPKAAIGTNSIDSTGAALLSDWYPSLDVPCLYELSVEAPMDFEVISEADSAATEEKENLKTTRFTFAHPASKVTMIAGKYKVRTADYNGITLSTYFLQSDSPESDQYLSNIKEYLAAYEQLLGRFPYTRFAVIESGTPIGTATSTSTGLSSNGSSATYMTIASAQLRMPDTATISLRREILRQWFGHFVHVAVDQGNWAEGLIRHLADHQTERIGDQAQVRRKKLLIDFSNQTATGQPTRLRDLGQKQDEAAQDTGHAKCAMVFHMLEKMIGEKDFFAAIGRFIADYKFKRASWDNIRDAFTTTSSNSVNLNRFFASWVDQAGIPALEMRTPTVAFRNGEYQLSFDINQSVMGAPFVFNLPVQITTAAGTTSLDILINDKTIHFLETFPKRPEMITIDSNYDVMRRLDEEEVPPTMATFFDQKDSLVIIPKDNKELSDVAEFFKTKGFAVSDTASNEIAKKRSLLLVSAQESELYRRLYAADPFPRGGFVARALRNPLNPRRAIVAFAAGSNEELLRSYKEVVSNSNYSLLRFENGELVAKQIDRADEGIVIDLTPAVDAVETKSRIEIGDVIERIRDKKVVLIGESHTSYGHHLMQLEIIERLQDIHKKIIIGMEMFQRPFQEYLDQYLAGKIDEAQMLKQTKYFDRWGYDYNLYRDILHFAKANKLPVIALNLNKEINQKVSRMGIDTLDKEEKSKIPPTLDMTNDIYRKNMREVFFHHNQTKAMNFDNFFQSQILWDETMAWTAAQAMERNPGVPMVILAGNGHLEHAWGIPDRIRRLTGQTSAVILNGGQEELNPSLADFVLYPESVPAPASKQLGILLDDAGEGLHIKEVMPSGAADRAGMKQKDIIKSIDGKPVAEIGDVKIALLDKKDGDHLSVEIERQRMLFGAKKLTLDVKL